MHPRPHPLEGCRKCKCTGSTQRCVWPHLPHPLRPWHRGTLTKMKSENGRVETPRRASERDRQKVRTVGCGGTWGLGATHRLCVLTRYTVETSAKCQPSASEVPLKCSDSSWPRSSWMELNAHCSSSCFHAPHSHSFFLSTYLITVHTTRHVVAARIPHAPSVLHSTPAVTVTTHSANYVPTLALALGVSSRLRPFSPACL